MNPAEATPRYLILCLDGTSNGPLTARSNVLKLASALERDKNQLVYYDPGVGTLANPARLSRFSKAIGRALDLATGSGLRDNVLEAYRFLMREYREGDTICLFGFSRGAYTARALCGMLQMVGLLPAHSLNMAPYLWHVYSNEDRHKVTFEKRMEVSHELRRHNRRPRVELLGLWDTVSSWGWFFNFRSLPWTSKLPKVNHIRHAVAIDEYRAAFGHNLFSANANKDLQEVWFAGGHADVGGGHPEPESGLSKLSLEWMIDEAKLHGIRFNETIVTRTLGRSRRTKPGRFAIPDPLAPMHTRIPLAWRLLEIMPRRITRFDERSKEWRRCWRINLGRKRIPQGRQAVHLSVGARSDASGYAPDGIVVDRVGSDG